jgi:hypothetical protein
MQQFFSLFSWRLLQLNMFRAFSRPSSGAQWLQWQPLVLSSYRGDSRAVFVVRPARPRTLSRAPVKTVTCREWRYQRLYIYNYDVDPLKMSRVCSKHVEDFNKCIICKEIRILCLKLEINQGYTTMQHGHPIIKINFVSLIKKERNSHTPPPQKKIWSTNQSTHFIDLKPPRKAGSCSVGLQFPCLLWNIRCINAACILTPPSLLYNGYRVFPRGKMRPGRAADHSPPF